MRKKVPKELKEKLTKNGCIVTGRKGPDLHHIRSVGAWTAINEEWNLLPICREIHCEIHQLGLARVADKYNRIRYWLLKNKWEFNTFAEKWIH